MVTPNPKDLKKPFCIDVAMAHLFPAAAPAETCPRDFHTAGLLSLAAAPAGAEAAAAWLPPAVDGG